MNSIFLKILVSVPAIVLGTLLFPALGVLLIFLRYAISDTRKDRRGSISLIAIGIILFIPKIILLLSEAFHFDPNVIPFFKNIITNDFYRINISNCAFALIIIGIFSLALSIIFKNLVNKFKNLLVGFVQNSIEKNEETHAKIKKENDLKIKQMEYQSQNSHVVSCDNCGATNTIVGNTGVCAYCRQPISNK